MDNDFAGIKPSSDIPESLTNQGEIIEKKGNIFKRLIEWYKYQSNFKKLVIISILFLVLIIIILGAIYLYIVVNGYQRSNAVNNNKSISTKFVIPTPTPTPITQIDPLTGLALSGDAINNLSRPPLAVMIENSIPARPQTGLNQADIVYETLAEGGITRYMGIFLSNTPSIVGPIRSARTYFLDWVNEYDAIYTHWGENSDVLPSLSNDDIRNVDALVSSGSGNNCNNTSSIFCRDYSREAPHNGYGFPGRIWQYGASLGWNSSSTFSAWNFKPDAQSANTGIDGQSIDISFMQDDADYGTEWTYRKGTDDYVKYIDNVAQVDKTDNSPISAKNIVIQFVDGNIYTSSGGKDVYHYNDIGNGKASIFEDGQEIDGTWKKDSLTSRTLFFDSNGNPVQFNRGRTWIDVLVNNTGSFTLSK